MSEQKSTPINKNALTIGLLKDKYNNYFIAPDIPSHKAEVIAKFLSTLPEEMRGKIYISSKFDFLTKKRITSLFKKDKVLAIDFGHKIQSSSTAYWQRTAHESPTVTGYKRENGKYTQEYVAKLPSVFFPAPKSGELPPPSGVHSSSPSNSQNHDDHSAQDLNQQQRTTGFSPSRGVEY